MAKLTPTNVLNTAYQYNNYLEKKSLGTDAQMQDKNWNAGYNNYTWFWVFLDRIGYGNYQAQPWCDGWVDYVFIMTAGGNDPTAIARAKKALGGFSAYTPTSADYFRQMGSQYYIKPSGTPQAGDVIFFKDGSGTICHTGIVTNVTSSTVYTIEGNTSSAPGVIDNGGCVREKSYSRDYARIACYGRPKWETDSTTVTTLRGSSVAEKVYNWGLDAGYSPQAISGILGNMKQESDVNPECLQKPTPYAAGIVQWERYNTNSGRFALMRKYAESKGKTWKDLLSQLTFMDMELSGADVKLGGDGYTASLIKKYAGSYEKFKALTDVEQAVKIFHDSFERSSQPMWEVRYKAANDFYKKFKGNSAVSSSSSSSSSILRKGDSGPEVAKMQNLLLNRGYDLGDYGADGDFGESTELALKEFQAYHNLEVDGEYGPQSRAILEKPFKRTYLTVGDSGSEVKTLQLNLLKAGYSVGASGADGDFGEGTKSGVLAFQKDQKLSATGMYDATTKAKLEAYVKKIDSNTKPVTDANTTTTKPTTTTSTTYKYGDENEEILKVAKLLNTTWNYTRLTPSKKFDEALLKTVVDFQTMNGLDVSGKLDKTTRNLIKKGAYEKPVKNLVYMYQLGANISMNAKLKVTGKWNEETGKASVPLKLGDSGYMVHFLQDTLVTKFKQDLKCNGAYDNATKKAVTYVQYYYGLEETGSMDRPTWNVLLCCDYPIQK